MRTLVRLTIAGVLGSMVGGAPPLFAQTPSTNLDQYLLFAGEELRIKGIKTPGGDLGVNDGLLFGLIDAPSSTLVGKQVRLKAKTKCAKLFANETARDISACGPAVGFSPPIVADLAGACGFPAPFDCGGEDVTVGKDATRSLAPGTWGDVHVMGAGGKGGTLRFAAGDYTLCSLRASRDARLLFDGAARVMVVGDIEVGNETFTGPAQGSGLSPFDVRFFSAGDEVHFSRKSRVDIVRLCAPDALLRLTEGTSLSGSLVARAIRTERITGGSTTTTTTTTATPTTVTTVTTTTTTMAPSTSTTTTSSSSTTMKPTTTTTMMMMGGGD